MSNCSISDQSWRRWLDVPVEETKVTHLFQARSSVLKVLSESTETLCLAAKRRQSMRSNAGESLLIEPA